MKKGGGGVPEGRLAAQIDADFGSFTAFKEEFTAGQWLQEPGFFFQTDKLIEAL